MKFAAFISIIVSVAVIFAACQGAVGPAGDQGPKGDTGDTGASGPPGLDAFVPLTAKAERPSIVISDTTNADNATIPGAAQTIDLADYIRGSAERTYGTPTSDLGTDSIADNEIFDATVDGSMLTITPKATQPDEAYVVEMFSVEISDGGESDPVTLSIPARRNRSPGFDLNATIPSGTVGTQSPATAPASVPMCPAANECYIDVTFTDADNTGTVVEELTFTATSADTTKVAVVSVDTAPLETPNPLVARLVVRGVASTWGETDHVPVEVIVMATDAGGETARGKANVSVDGAPTATAIPNGRVTSTSMYTITNVTGFFTDPEGVTSLEYAVESGNLNIVTAMVDANGMDLVVTYNGPGTTEVTVTATEPSTGNDPAQTAQTTFSVVSEQ